MTLGNDRFTAITQSGSVFTMNGERVEVQCSGDFIITSGGKIYLNAGAVDVGNGAVEPAVKGQSMTANWATHVHNATALGSPVSPPLTPPPVQPNELSLKVKIA